MKLICRDVLPEPLKSRFGGTSEVWGRSFALDPGARVLFRAPSGKGKSTFMHILYGLRRDYSGVVLWDDRDIREQTAEDWAGWRSRQLSIVFQDLRLFPELTVAENLYLKQALAPETSDGQAQEWMALLGMEDKWLQKAGTLSYGERQRTAIVRALLQPFRWLLLDEPFSHLDDANIRIAASLITRRIEEQNAGLLMADLEDEHRLDFSRKVTL